MAGKVKDSLVLNGKCPRCFHGLERWEISGDEREVMVADVCWNCGFEVGKRIEKKRKAGGA